MIKCNESAAAEEQVKLNQTNNNNGKQYQKRQYNDGIKSKFPLFHWSICITLTIGFIVTILLCVMFHMIKSTQENNLRCKDDDKKTNVDVDNDDENQFNYGEQTNEMRRKFVKQMTLEAWNEYCTYAWKHDSLNPISNEPYDDEIGFGSGRTIVSALSTLWIMDLGQEFHHAKEWVENELSFAPKINNSKVTLHFALTEYVGSLLSIYALTNDWMFVVKAIELADTIMPELINPNGLLFDKLNFTNLYSNNPIDVNMFLWTATQSLEFAYLSYITGNQKYVNQIHSYRSIFDQILKQFDKIGYRFETNYLLHFSKVFRQNHSDLDAFDLWNQSANVMETIEHKIIERSRTGLYYIRDYDYELVGRSNWMEFDSCTLNSLLSLGSRSYRQIVWRNWTKTIESHQLLEHARQRLMLAIELTETCRQASIRSRTGLPPARFYFTNLDDATNKKGDDRFKQFYLNPELAESYYTMYQLTMNPIYREYAWDLVQAIYRHCRLINGSYTTITNVEWDKHNNKFQQQQQSIEMSVNLQPSYLIGATFKYLYLIFDDDTNHNGKFQFESWIFNSMGQPLPILNNNIGRT